MWEAIEKAGWIAGILSLLVAIASSPQVVKHVRTVGQRLAAATVYAALGLAVLSVFRRESAVDRVRSISAATYRLVAGIGIPPTASLIGTTLILGAAASAIFTPTRIAIIRQKTLAWRLHNLRRDMERENATPRDLAHMQRDSENLGATSDSAPFAFSFIVNAKYVSLFAFGAVLFFPIEPVFNYHSMQITPDWPLELRWTVRNMQILDAGILRMHEPSLDSLREPGHAVIIALVIACVALQRWNDYHSWPWAGHEYQRALHFYFSIVSVAVMSLFVAPLVTVAYLGYGATTAATLHVFKSQLRPDLPPDFVSRWTGRGSTSS